MRAKTDNVDYIAAVLHGRRGGMAEGSRLEALSRLRTMPQLSHEVFPGQTIATAGEMHREWITLQVGELMELASHLEPKWAALIHWVAMRYALGNLKTTIRGFVSGAGKDRVLLQHIPMPKELEVELASLGACQSLEELIHLMSRGPPWLADAMEMTSARSRLFMMESVLDHGYFLELIKRTARLRGEEGRYARDLMSQWVDAFHVMLVARGHLTYHIEPSLLRPMHVEGSHISRSRFHAMLAAADAVILARLVLGRAIDALPRMAEEQGDVPSNPAISALETCVRNRSCRLAHQVFRKSHMGEGAIVAFTELRRIEVENLTTLSEGVRLGKEEDAIRSRFVSRVATEVSHV